MKRSPQAILLVLSGTGLLHISLLTDLYLRYVKDWTRPTLIASGVLLLLLGVADAWSHRGPGPSRDEGERGAHEDHDGHRHDHSGVPRAAWLLLLPALSMLFYAPPALGAYTASRQASKPIAVQQDDFEPLPALSPLPLTLGDFTSRVRQDRTGRQGTQRPDDRVRHARRTGRGLGPDPAPDQLLLGGRPGGQSTDLRGETPPADTWVTVVGTWHADGTLGTGSAAIALDARTVSEVDRPTDWYRDALPLPLPADGGPVLSLTVTGGQVERGPTIRGEAVDAVVGVRSPVARTGWRSGVCRRSCPARTGGTSDGRQRAPRDHSEVILPTRHAYDFLESVHNRP